MSRSAGATPLTSSPPSRTSPAVARSRPAATRRTVVLPDPDGPTRTRNSPSATRRSRFSTATVPSSNVLRRPRNSSSAISASIPCCDQIAIPERAPFRNAQLGRIVDVDDPEPLLVTRLPLEVVEQRPDEVAADIDSPAPRLLHRRHVRPQIVDAPLVLDHAVVEPVVEGGAVLGDQQREIAVVVLEPEQERRQRLGRDRPTHG